MHFGFMVCFRTIRVLDGYRIMLRSTNVLLFVLMLYVPVNSYGHVGTSPPISWDFYPALR